MHSKRLPSTLLVLAALAPAAAGAEAPNAERLDTTFGIVRSPAFSLSPRFSPLGGDALNDDVTVGLSITIQPASFVGFEANISLFPRGGEANATPTAVAALSLIDRGTTAFESVDRLGLFTGMALFAPVSGYLAPPGLPGIHVELLLGAGGGLELVHLENLQLSPGGDVALVDEADLRPRGVVSGLVGARFAPIPAVAARFDLRVVGGSEQVLDYTTDEAASLNRSLPSGSTSNRSHCGEGDAVCRVAPFGSFTLEFAIEFTLGAKWSDE